MCEDCGKKPSTFHMTEIINGKGKEVHLCEDCASKNEDFSFNSSFTIQSLLAGLLDIPTEENFKVEDVSDLSCESCGTTYEEFRRRGKFGCSCCYSSFREKLEPLLKKIHGHDTHVGKIPKRTGGMIKIKKDINILKNKLQVAVINEEFERAAELRDEIKKLQSSVEKVEKVEKSEGEESE